MQGKSFPQRRTRRAVVRGALFLSDVVAVVAATQLAALVRFGAIRHVVVIPEIADVFQLFDISLIICAIWLAGLWFEGLYDLDRVFWGSGEFSRVIKALSGGMVLFILAEYAMKMSAISRGWTLLAWAFAATFVVLGRSLVRVGVVAARRRGRLLRPTLIVGFNGEAADIISVLRKDTSSGLVPLGCLASSQEARLGLDYCVDPLVPCLGYAREIGRVLDERFIDTVIIASTAFDHDVVSRIINDLRGRDVDIQLSSGLFDVTTSRVLVREVSGVPLITLKAVGFAPWQRWLKRAFDVIVGGAITLAGMPVWLLLALLIKIDSRGPVFYRQERVGHDGRPFGMLKFRSMRADADERLEELREHNEATGPLFKMQDDPRVTRVGRWMRRYSIDEFPQLLNVLSGDMSLVGPRPSLPSETAAYTDYHWRRLEVPPGMTGLWQVSGRSRLTFEEMVRLDLFYIENWTVGFDMGLLVRTVPAVLFARGAY